MLCGPRELAFLFFIYFFSKSFFLFDNKEHRNLHKSVFYFILYGLGVFREVEGRDLTHILIHPRVPLLFPDRVALSGCPREIGGDARGHPLRATRELMFSCEAFFFFFVLENG